MNTTRRRLLACALACLIASICLPGCGDCEDTGAGGTCPSPFGTKPAAPLTKNIKFAPEIGRKSYPQAAAPQPAPLLNWDFSTKKTYAYDYTQKVVNRADLGGPGGMDQSMDAEMTLLVRSKGDGTATLVMKDAKVSMTMDVDGKTKKMQSGFPSIVVQGMKEDGSMRVGDNSAELLLKLLFPMPTRPLKPGESVDVPASMPFNAMGSVLNVDGVAKITLTGYVTVDGRTCARLETEIDISKLEVPKELKGTYECFTKGKSISYFDVKERSFVNLELALTMAVRADVPTPEMKIDDEQVPDMPANMGMSMQMDTLLRLSRNPEKTAAENK